MPRYMVQFSYTPEAWSTLMRKPEDRSQALGRLAESLGGRLVDLYYAFGDHDGLAIIEAPDNASAAATVLAAVGPGHVKATRTTPLLTVDELMEALRKAGGVGYHAPGKSGD